MKMAVIGREWKLNPYNMPWTRMKSITKNPLKETEQGAFDLKSPTGCGKNIVYGLIAKKRKQSDNFVIDITECPLNEEEIEQQIEHVPDSLKRSF